MDERYIYQQWRCECCGVIYDIYMCRNEQDELYKDDDHVCLGENIKTYNEED